MKLHYSILSAFLVSFGVNGDSSTLDAAIGGGVGGATGAAIGNEVGGRNDAIMGGALGAAIGTAVNTDDEPKHTSTLPKVRYEYSQPRREHPHYYHCPPGQRKKGRC